jgi:hypothetical protein
MPGECGFSFGVLVNNPGVEWADSVEEAPLGEFRCRGDQPFRRAPLPMARRPYGHFTLRA